MYKYIDRVIVVIGNKVTCIRVKCDETAVCADRRCLAAAAIAFTPIASNTDPCGGNRPRLIENSILVCITVMYEYIIGIISRIDVKECENQYGCKEGVEYCMGPGGSSYE